MWKKNGAFLRVQKKRTDRNSPKKKALRDSGKEQRQ